MSMFSLERTKHIACHGEVILTNNENYARIARKFEEEVSSI